ncbi:hypothetical protein FRC14_001515 [Serendipita sp. 396]|nr:hypothetical protein FRC14_001515 [Serendipita sp. 396]
MSGLGNHSPKRPEPITVPAIKSDFDNAFDSDDSDTNANFDLKSAIPGLRAKLEEEQASYEAEELSRNTFEEPEQNIEIIQGDIDAEPNQDAAVDTRLPLYVIRRNEAEQEEEQTQEGAGLPVSPFALEYNQMAQSAPATSTSYSTAISGPDAYQPHRRKEGRSLDGEENLEEDGDAPLQSLEDVSLEDDAAGSHKSTQTPPSGHSRPPSTAPRNNLGGERSAALKTMGAARIGAMLLINIPLPHTFVTMRNLLDRHCMRSFYGGQKSRDEVEAYFRIFDTLLADSLPKVYFNFKQHHISPSEYLSDWLITMFIDHLPFEACARIWDVLLLEGDSFLFRAALGIIHVLEPRLFFPDRDELIRVLKGESKAAVEAAKRAAGAAGTEIHLVDLGARYEVYGLDEETIWERLEESEEWWKESTWSRLILRELPDA